MNLELARVLVVEDDAVMQAFVVNSLQRLGVPSIEIASDGQSALRAMMVFKPHVVLTDIHMQPMNGLDFVREMRAHPSPMVKNMKVIFMSTDASTATLEDAMPLGTFGYIVKPPRLNTLKAKLEQALK
jgi:CheY-like chemotaxis protein